MRKFVSSSPVSVGVLLVALGFIAMFLAWNGAADKDFISGQLPYVISGGMVGLALVGSGLTVINVQARRADQAELINRLEAMLETRDAHIQEVAARPARRPRKAS